MSIIPRRSNLGHHWNLKETTIFLNHGSFGACPKIIFDSLIKFQKQLEFEPVNFLFSVIVFFVV